MHISKQNLEGYGYSYLKATALKIILGGQRKLYV